ncbi:MAG: flagellar hook-associated protein FlgK [Lachnospiraceae bacterium]|nr:flagellar hook-associated protein FlgK [Lachnospiraceae bacterium]
MSLFSGLYVGSSGLVTNQNALNTTAHNLANVGTTGYTRQQTIQANKNYDTIGQAAISAQQVGLGVQYADVRAVRDYFLDKAYRAESGRAEYYSTSYNAISEMENLFGEMEGTAFQTALVEFTRAVEELAKSPSDATNQGLLVSKATSFIERAQSVYEGLSEYQDNLDAQITGTIDKINEYGNKIWELNQQIIAVEAGGIERANDLRDTRDLLLDKLSAYGKISYEEQYNGVVTVQFEGVDFVNQDYVNEMGYMTGGEYNERYAEDISKGTRLAYDTNFHIPVWPKFANQNVFSTSEEISSDKNTDIGALKAMFNLRGNKRGTYRDLYPVGEEYPDYNNPGTKTAISSSESVKRFENVTKRAAIMTVMAEFDNLVHGVVTGMNSILSSDGKAEGTSDDVLLFSKIADSVEDDTDGWSTKNIMVNPNAQQVPTSIDNGFLLDDGSEDRSRADALVNLFSNEFDTLNPNTNTKLTFEAYYRALVSENATNGSTYYSISSNQETMRNSIDSQRQEVVGVSDSDELTQMIRYQNAYNASSRYINTINSMLDSLINSLT